MVAAHLRRHSRAHLRGLRGLGQDTLGTISLRGAEEHSVPLEREYVQVKRHPGQLVITAAYIETMTFVPGYPYAREFDVEAKTFEGVR